MQNFAEFASNFVIFRRDFRRILPEFREIAANYTKMYSKIKLDLILLLKWFNFDCRNDLIFTATMI